MSLDYARLGFKCGLEIHQQLEGEKLFCHCPTQIRKEGADFLVKRRLRASAGESGARDQAAAFEQVKQKEFIYQGYHDSICLVELDEEPPHNINPQALQTSIQIAKLLNCKIADRIIFMRKTIVDGSNTSAFQRTALIGRNGYLEVNGKKVGITAVCLEEEACQVMERKEKEDTYNLSRLGIPLIEIATDASIHSPEECKIVAEKLGLILRSVPGMKRGIGTIRQDVNISIKGGARTEIKGFQEYKAIPKVVDVEVIRQLDLVKQGKPIDSGVRKAEADFTTSFLRPMPGADRMYPETDVQIIIPKIEELAKVELLEDKAKKFMDLGMSKDLAMKIVKSSDLALFENLLKYNKVKPAFIAETLISYDSDIKGKFKEADPKKVTPKHWEELFKELNEEKIAKTSVLEILGDICTGKKMDLKNYEIVSDDELKKELEKVIKENPSSPPGMIIGKIMEKYKGKVDGKKVAELASKIKR
ncbi:MAG: Glu-tRNA(Gln) amidotransferase subunit GatE [Nanoarchaeota archaeon]